MNLTILCIYQYIFVCVYGSMIKSKHTAIVFSFSCPRSIADELETIFERLRSLVSNHITICFQWIALPKLCEKWVAQP